MLDAKAFTRFDVSRDTTFNVEGRYFLSTDYPGSPNVPADVAKLPIFHTYGTTLGLTQRFNHFEIAAKAIVDRTEYQDSDLTDGTTSSNHDRDFNQYGGSLRGSYEVFPGVKPFVEIAADTRKHDLQFDRNGFERDSNALTPKVGTSFEISQKLTGEASVGYLMRKYKDPNLRGTARHGVRRLADLCRDRPHHRDADRQLDGRRDRRRRRFRRAAPRRRPAGRSRVPPLADRHAEDRLWPRRLHRRDRVDSRVSLGCAAAITYKLNREFWLKGEYRYDQLRSNVAGVDLQRQCRSSLVGLKLQRGDANAAVRSLAEQLLISARNAGAMSGRSSA